MAPPSPATAIAPPSPNFTLHLPTNGDDSTVVEADPNSGPSTHEKKNRKKRVQKGKDNDNDVEAKKLRTTNEVDETYKQCSKQDST
ncbi:hypothetical protein E2562_022572 [Oryza meyeriana var. granulata]|uniref:Uncharacterized protein n=1 Tax=Oryza meyeriana var. granulata TaxID=110450 RepID=A0A6G1CHW3_9ORYZ|nr:hypothetical protein E2562_022572 [Oryza meyeriana var. granulata]